MLPLRRDGSCSVGSFHPLTASAPWRTPSARQARQKKEARALAPLGVRCPKLASSLRALNEPPQEIGAFVPHSGQAALAGDARLAPPNFLYRPMPTKPSAPLRGTGAEGAAAVGRGCGSRSARQRKPPAPPTGDSPARSPLWSCAGNKCPSLIVRPRLAARARKLARASAAAVRLLRRRCLPILSASYPRTCSAHSAVACLSLNLSTCRGSVRGSPLRCFFALRSGAGGGNACVRLCRSARLAVSIAFPPLFAARRSRRRSFKAAPPRPFSAAAGRGL